MCTIGRTAGGTACKAHHRTDRTQYPLRYGQERKDYGTEGCRSSFLNTTFQPKPLPSLVVEDSDGKRHNLITRDNYGFLRDSFFRYAYLMEKEAVHTPGRTFGEGIARLHEEMDALVGEGLNVNIEEQDGRLLFKLWKAHHWGKLTLYYFPMKFVEALGSELRRISITFIHELMKANGIQTVLDEDDTEYVLTWISEEVPEETPEERKKRLRLLRSYENGSKHRKKNPPCNILAKWISLYLFINLKLHHPVNIQKKYNGTAYFYTFDNVYHSHSIIFTDLTFFHSFCTALTDIIQDFLFSLFFNAYH